MKKNLYIYAMMISVTSIINGVFFFLGRIGAKAQTQKKTKTLIWEKTLQ